MNVHFVAARLAVLGFKIEKVSEASSLKDAEIILSDRIQIGVSSCNSYFWVILQNRDLICFFAERFDIVDLIADIRLAQDKVLETLLN